MTQDPFWDELGVAWVAAVPKIGAITPQLESRLRGQTMFIRGALLLGICASVAGLILGGVTIWIGVNSGAWNFVTRGIALLAMALLAGVAAGALSPVRASDEARALSEMIELSIARARRALLTVRLALWACAVAGVFGLAGSVLRTHLSGPPKMSPVVDLALLGVVAVALVLYRQNMTAALAKFEYLKRALAADAA